MAASGNRQTVKDNSKNVYHNERNADEANLFSRSTSTFNYLLPLWKSKYVMYEYAVKNRTEFLGYNYVIVENKWNSRLKTIFDESVNKPRYRYVFVWVMTFAVQIGALNQEY